jgi:hypothetical protein
VKYFLDTEFIEAGHSHPIELISLGMVSDDNRSFYAQVLPSHGRTWLQPNDFVARHVYPQLEHFDMGSLTRACIPGLMTGDGRCSEECPWITRENLKERILAFVGDEEPEFWGYYADYDWVVFCQIFGAMIDLPKGWPMYCRDLKQWADSLMHAKFPSKPAAAHEHNALVDAIWNKDAHAALLAQHTIEYVQGYATVRR